MYKVVAYYTKNTIYEKKVVTLQSSLDKFHIPYHIEAINNLGDWYKNTSYKPTFLKGMLLKYPNEDIVYVDVDAEFLSYPSLFEEYSKDPNVNIAVHNFDRSVYGKQGIGKFEVLSGTIFLKNNSKTLEIVKEWEQQCINNPRIWDQRSLEKVLKGQFTNLPMQYCKIFDKGNCDNPVIIHYQVSREIRKNKGKLI